MARSSFSSTAACSPWPRTASENSARRKRCRLVSETGNDSSTPRTPSTSTPPEMPLPALGDGTWAGVHEIVILDAATSRVATVKLPDWSKHGIRLREVRVEDDG